MRSPEAMIAAVHRDSSATERPRQKTAIKKAATCSSAIVPAT